MKIYGLKSGDSLIFPPAQVAMEQQWIDTQKECTPIVRETKVYRGSKTEKQLGDWWGLFCRVVLENFNDNGWDSSFLLKLDKPTGIPPSKELLKEYMYSVCPIFDSDGHRITMSKADTQQMAKFQTDCRNFASSQWAIYVPEPDANWRNKNELTTRQFNAR